MMTQSVLVSIASTNRQKLESKFCRSSKFIVSNWPCHITRTFVFRFLVSARDISTDEIIIDGEEPLVVGPKQATHPVIFAFILRFTNSNKLNNWQLNYLTLRFV